ncbi:hypothetical protein TNCV_3928721 [Trichonephila clavipes]|nr:hypothetical protein TNCV_3928721 [Trichonephila clavipes]
MEFSRMIMHLSIQRDMSWFYEHENEVKHLPWPAQPTNLKSIELLWFENPSPISVTGQSFKSNDVEIGAPINGDASVNHHFSTTKSDTSEHESRIVPCDTFPPDEYTPIIRSIEKLDSLEKRIMCAIHFSSSSHILLHTPCGCDGTLLLV